MRYLGVDIGSSSIKGAVLDLESGEVAGIEREPFPDPLAGLPALHFEVDPLAVAERTRKVISRLLAKAPDARGVCFSSQMGGVLIVDDSRTPLTNYLSWRDQRTTTKHQSGGTFLDEMQRRWDQPAAASAGPIGVLASLGNELKPGSATSLLFWLTEHDRLPDGIPCSIGAFVIGHLCGARVLMDRTEAIGLLNIQDSSPPAWHHAAFEALGFKHLRWPALVDTPEPVGWLHDVPGAQGRIPCFAAIGDQQCALRGVGLQLDELSLNVSTGSQVSRLATRYTPGPYQTRPYFNGLLLDTITHLPAGRSLNVLVDLLTELSRAEDVSLTRVWQTISREADAAATDGLAVDLAFFAGTLGNTGHIAGITTENLTIGRLFRAAFTNMADNYRLCADRLCSNDGGASNWQRIALSGGMTQSLPVLRQLIQSRFSIPLRESTAAEETLLGLLEFARQVES